jgi:hypothetical protein
VKNDLTTFCRRLDKIGIKVELSSNIPWVYLLKVNGKQVGEEYLSDYGFTAFWYPVKLGSNIKFTNRHKVFNKVREILSS